LENRLFTKPGGVKEKPATVADGGVEV